MADDLIEGVTRTGRPGAKASAPKLLTTGGPDILILDDKNTLFRWRPSNSTGKGTLVRVKIKDSASWGDDVKDISTFVANFDAAFYKLYVVDPSEQNIMVLSPANDGSGYPVDPTPRLPTAAKKPSHDALSCPPAPLPARDAGSGPAKVPWGGH